MTRDRTYIGIVDHQNPEVMAAVRAIAEREPHLAVYDWQLGRAVFLTDEPIDSLPAIGCQNEEDETVVLELLAAAGIRWKWVYETIPEGFV